MCSWRCIGRLFRFIGKRYRLGKNALNVASYQLKNTAEELADSGLLPRSVWTGYELSFLTEQMEQPLENFQDSLWSNPPASKLGKGDFVIFTIGQVGSFLVAFGMFMS